MSTTNKKSPSSWTTLTVTHLASLANSATAGWQSAVIDDAGLNTTYALDYEIGLSLPMANTAPSSPSAVYVYVCPAFYISSNWYYADGGTATLPGGTEGTYTIASPNDLVLAKVLNYTTTQMTLQSTFLLSSVLGQFTPDGFSLIIVNNSGAAVAASSVVVGYRPIFETNG